MDLGFIRISQELAFIMRIDVIELYNAFALIADAFALRHLDYKCMQLLLTLEIYASKNADIRTKIANTSK